MNTVTGKIVYVSAGMSGIKNLNRETFDFARDVLTKLGAKAVLLPTILPPGLEYEHYIHIDFAMIDVSDTVCLCDNWIASLGANREKRHACYRDKNIIEFQQCLDRLSNKKGGAL